MTLAEYNAWYARQLLKIDAWYAKHPYPAGGFVAHSLRYEPPRS